MPLTDTAVRQAKAKEKDYSVTDGDGLALFVSANGTKSWHFRYSWHGKQPRISLGTYPEIGLRDARELRDQARSMVARGIDPRSERRQAQQASAESQQNTFEIVAERWYAFRSPRLSNAAKGGRHQSRLYLDKDLLPVLGKLPIADIRRADVLAAVRRVEKRGALNVAEKCRTWLNQIFRFAIAEGLIETNPAADMDIVAAAQPPVRHNPYLKREELKPFLLKLREYDGSLFTLLAIRLLILTGVRTGEVRAATPGQFDLDAGLWTIPPENVKQLALKVKDGSGDIPPYLVPLSRQAVDVARQLMSMTGQCKLLIPGRNNPNTPMSENTVNDAISRMGYKGKLTGHGLRATLSTALNEMGYNPDWIEAQLSHAGENKVRRAYNHAAYVEQRRGMMQDWADYLDSVEAS
ncbi:Integrase [Pseudomonas syringae pv. cilantro]|uniref:Integrase n=2 Tax=Pseudomonas syringae group TaxID=136849 RepID=A0A0N0XC86_PSESX|nr:MULTISPECIES: integrase arm-type DNA-binding domain-containing protein [Pseudomonas syringae group]KPC32562.1 Integrase [Pseudomonas syringae pv. cilantro]KPW72998.1 Integrase [Pseudomonas syringae pv. coriandricola]RMN14382.1 Integrase [Pseudomonas syringae pv. coriandricola]